MLQRKPAEQVSREQRLKQLISARNLADRYSIHLRTVARWVSRGTIPPPDQIINDKRYWYLETIEKADRQNTANAAATTAAAPTAT